MRRGFVPFLRRKGTEKNLKHKNNLPARGRGQVIFVWGRRAVMRSPVVCRCRGQRPQRPAEGSRPLPTMQRIRGGNGKVEGRACPAPTDCSKRLVDERGKGGRQPSPDGAGGAEPRPYAHSIPTAGVRGRLAAHNERRQPAKLARSCGCLPRRGKHCSLPSFAPLNCGPALATPQPPTQKWRKARWR